MRTPTTPTMEIAKDKRVLVIDDDARALEAISGLLQSWGFNVVNAQSLPAALAQTGAHPPDLIISDYHLQNETTGIDVIEHLRSKFDAKIPAFLISGDTALQSGHRTSMAGYVILHKPVEPMALRAAVERFLKGHAEGNHDR